MTGPVLVTGAGGFIGRAVVARLAETGVPLRAGLHRLPEGRSPAEGTVRCDLDEARSLDAACAGASAIIHAGGRSAAAMPDQLRALLAAAERAGIDRVVHLSSIAVYGPEEGRIGEPDAPPATAAPDDPYCAAKRACEAILRAWIAARPGRRAAILRPGIVYGRGSVLWVDRPAAALRAGVLGDLGPRGEGIAALVHIGDVAEAVRCALAALNGSGARLLAANLVGPDTPTWNAYFAALAGRAGLPAPRRLPPGRLALLRVLAVPAKAMGRLHLPAPRSLRLVPASGELRLFARAARYDTARARTDFGFRPAIRLAEGLADALP
ncbi:NAD-dependent epimerase/dehydratase family protein [Methylobacterium sp. J-076]|uniref:NAD-dependent epimerase/dehydratase family protein n=1 Tax=Methylobacterium sp. J-076 TaxID=2836655 RepID=UPI001FBBAA7F|nr:NAD-dependent epimerase/dehydratase family protein [Methylobacterium sp. J-076]MCJ2013386.1 NAD-dependent epimerase/dehydratase family protein [Methylobacterium sp. J-076]